jgi:Rrf2 family transcriptional regulator, iron-sulfur cluster assembly transcription factor
MLFSKSFGYAVRGILYIATMQDEKRYVQVEEIAEKLAVPRHFMGKVLKNLVKEGVLASNKGPSGGFTINESTLDTSLFRLIEITDGLSTFRSCVLRVKECNPLNPCPLHGQIEGVKSKLERLLAGTKIIDLMGDNKSEFIKSISTAVEEASFDQLTF